MIVLDLPPGARARGRAHGEALRHKIREHLETWMANLDGGRASDPSAWLDRFIDDTSFTPAVQRWTPELIEEVQGIAEGAHQPLRQIWALQMLDEEWAHSMRRASVRRTHDKCSTFAIGGDAAARPTLVGQNMDLGGYTDGFQVVLRLAADAGTAECLVFSLAGMIGLMGVSGAGVAVHVNTLAQLPSAASGLPVAFVMRGALACRNAGAAADFVAGVAHASGQHYLLADPRVVLSLEGSAAGSLRFAGQRAGRILHTNHPLAGTNGDAGPQAGNSVSRLASLEGRLCGPSLPGIADAKAALSSFDDPANPVCRVRRHGSGQIGFTTGSMLSSLHADAPVVSEIAVGPPSENPYRQFELKGRGQLLLRASGA